MTKINIFVLGQRKTATASVSERTKQIRKSLYHKNVIYNASNFAAGSLLDSKMYGRLIMFDVGLSRKNADFENYIDW